MNCAAVREHAPELALGILSGAERAEVLHHLNACTRCQAFVDEQTEVADLFLHLAPELEPPSGFARRVSRDAFRGRARRARRLVAALAITAAAATIVSIALVRVIDAGDGESKSTAAPRLRTVSMVGANGQPVGRVTVSKGEPASVAVTVDYAVPDGSYALELRAADLDPDGFGTLTITDGRGEWSGPITLPRNTDRATLALVGAFGTTVCEAHFPT